jgi:hypothetical protein
MLEDTDPIYCYARADAIADGTLVDITEAACEAGFRVPVALTRTVWCDCVHWGPDDNVGPLYQDEAGRLWESSRPGEPPPEALTEPDVNVSAHPAPPIQPAQSLGVGFA